MSGGLRPGSACFPDSGLFMVLLCGNAAVALLLPVRYLFGSAGLVALAIVPALGVVLVATKRGEWRTNPLAVAVLSGWLLALLFHGNAPSSGSALRLTYETLTGGFIAVWITMLVPADRAVTGLRAMVGLAAVVAIIGIVEFVQRGNPIYGQIFQLDNPDYADLVHKSNYGGDYRIRSTVGHPVAVGSLMMMALPAAAAWFRSSHGVARALPLLAVAALATSLVLSLTRGAMVAGLVAMACYLRFRVVWFACALVCAMAVLALASPEFMHSAKERVSIHTERLLESERAIAVVSTADVAAVHSLTGLGVGNYWKTHRSHGGELDAPDNQYLRWLAEGGVILLTAALWPLLLSTRYLTRPNGAIANRDTQRASLSLLIGAALHMLLFDLMGFPATRVFFWTCIGFGLAAGTVEPRQRNCPVDRVGMGA